MATRARNQFKGSLADVARYRKVSEFNFRGQTYVYSDRLFLMAKTAYDEARENNTDETIVLVAKDLTKRKLTLNVVQLKNLVQKCFRTARKMEVERTKVDEVQS